MCPRVNSCSPHALVLSSRPPHLPCSLETMSLPYLEHLLAPVCLGDDQTLPVALASCMPGLPPSACILYHVPPRALLQPLPSLHHPERAVLTRSLCTCLSPAWNNTLFFSLVCLFLLILQVTGEMKPSPTVPPPNWIGLPDVRSQRPCTFLHCIQHKLILC